MKKILLSIIIILSTLFSFSNDNVEDILNQDYTPNYNHLQKPEMYSRFTTSQEEIEQYQKEYARLYYNKTSNVINISSLFDIAKYNGLIFDNKQDRIDFISEILYRSQVFQDDNVSEISSNFIIRFTGSNTYLTIFTKEENDNAKFKYTNFYISGSMNDNENREAYERAEEIASSIDENLSDEEKAREVANLIRKTNKYIRIKPKYKNDLNNNAYGSLIQNYSKCQGFSTAYQIIMRKLNIPTYTIVGDNGNGGHAWNLVYINNKWSYIDLTPEIDKDNEIPKVLFMRPQNAKQFENYTVDDVFKNIKTDNPEK